MNVRDINVLEHIIGYCEEIAQTIKSFDDKLETLKANHIYKNAASMCVLQIGELTTHLSKDFVGKNTEIPWSNIKRMRDIAAHHYGKFSMEKLHETIMFDIPALKVYCQNLLDRQ